MQTDSLKMPKDSIKVDSLSLKNKKSNQITSPIKYASKDSMMFSVKSKMIFAYGDANLGMDNMKLESGFIKMNMDSNYLFAKSILDAKGEETGKPVFTEGDEKYDIKTIKYNLKTKKALVTDVVTEMGGGYMRASITKMQPNKEIHISDGKFSTCDAEHPHFYIQLTKAKVIPGKKIISGPFYFVISDIPLPLGLPFGYFPDQNKRTSGIVIPTYGEEKRRGFYLKQGGYYFALSDYIDLTTLGEIYTSGSWGLNVRSNYKKRYKYSGSMDLTYNEVVTSEKGLSDYSKTKMFWVRLNYARDTKAMPNASFNTSLNFGSSKSRLYNNTENPNSGINTPNSFANNNTSSSIAYTKSWPGLPFNFSANMSANQNLTTHLVNLELPTLALTMTTQHPFKKIKTSGGKGNWYKELSVGFSTNIKNSLNIADSLLLTNEAVKKMTNGLQYKIPISTSIKLFKFFNFSPSFSYTGRIYSNSLNKHIQEEDVINSSGDTIKKFGKIYTDTVQGFNHVYDFSFSAPISTKLYGMVNFKKGKIAAIRHVMSPSVSFGYKPDFASETWNFYDWDPTYPRLDKNYNKRYSRFGNGVYGDPPRGKSGSIGFGLDNNLEMKVHSTDTAQPLKKVVLLSRLNFSTSYNIAADSINWAPISISANTKLFKQINANYSSTIEIYDIDSTGQLINQFYYKNHKGIGRFARNNITLGGSISSETFKKKKKEDKKDIVEEKDPELEMGSEELFPKVEKGKDKKKDEPKVDADGYSFSIPWNISINYTFSLANTFNKTTQAYVTNLSQTLNINGDFSLTEKWKVNGGFNYDFKAKKMAYSHMSISRDLHCWQMGLDFVPFGTYQSYSFRISAKSSMLKGMEYKKQSSWQDNL